MAQKNTNTQTNANTETQSAETQSASPAMVPANGLGMFLSSVVVPETVTQKVQLSQEIRQRLAEARDLELQGGAAAKEADKIAGPQIIRLYQARADGAFTADEVTGLLGDIYGYRMKKDGKPSKTPEGKGKAIRDRVVRFYNAHEHIEGRDGSAFFEGLPKDKTAAILNGAKNNPWDAYEQFGKLRSSVNVRPALAFDPKRILGIAADLSEEGAADKVRANVSLQRAYGELLTSLAVIGQGQGASNDTGSDTETETDEETGEQAAA